MEEQHKDDFAQNECHLQTDIQSEMASDVTEKHIGSEIEIIKKDELYSNDMIEKFKSLSNEWKEHRDFVIEKMNELSQKEIELVQRELSIVDRELKADVAEAKRLKEKSLNLDKEFLQERGKFEEEIAEYKKKKHSDLDDEITELRKKKHSDLDDEITELRKKKLDFLSSEMEKEQQRIQEEVESARTAFLEEKKLAEKEISNQRTALETLRGTLSVLESELAGRQQQLEQDEKRFERQEEQTQERYNTRFEKLDDEVADRIQEAKANFEAQLADSKKENARLLGSLRTQSELAGAFEILKRQLGDQDPSEIILKLNSQTDELTRLREELATRPTDEMRTRFEVLDTENKNLKQKVEELKNQLTSTNTEIAEVGELKRKNSELEAENASLEKRASLWEAASNEAQEELQRLRATYERKQDIYARYAEIEMPYLDGDAVQQPQKKEEKEGDKGDKGEESAWLQGIISECDNYGLHFNPRIVKAFHTALKIADWAPITVLAGVSGTGKSELPKLYSHFGGIFFMPLAVQPNWDSQESMLGFFNSIDNKFDAQNVLRFLAQSQKKWGKMGLEQVYIKNCNLIDEWAKSMSMDKNAPDYIQRSTKKWIEEKAYSIPDYPGLKNAVCMVLLDEMNLAHPELYFAEFLSKLELRRGYNSKNAPFIDVKVGAGIKPYELPLGRNVLWTGTMNQDETTKSLSDKVLDRSIVIHFPRPTDLKSRKAQQTLTLENRGEILHRSIWESWIERSSTFTDQEILPFKTFLEKMNSALGVVGRAIGHRVWQSVEYYMANYPDVRVAKANKDEQALAQAMHIAFEDQLVQKVMPKLRGIDTRGDSKTECLDKIRGQIIAGVNEQGFNLIEDFDLACKLGYGQFIWQSANYLKESQDDINS